MADACPNMKRSAEAAGLDEEPKMIDLREFVPVERLHTLSGYLGELLGMNASSLTEANYTIPENLFYNKISRKMRYIVKPTSAK